MNNIEKQLYIQGDFMVDITPLEVMELVEETLDSLNQTELIKPNELFRAYSMFTFFDLLAT